MGVQTSYTLGFLPHDGKCFWRGAELFWRGWFMNKWKVDQAVKNVKPVNGDFKNGAQITVENIGQLPMPTTVLMTFKDGTTQTVKLPVEVWKRNTEWTFQIDSNKEVTNVKLDPQSIVPDINPKNNFWPAN